MSWVRSGWVTDYPSRPDLDSLVDYICDKCATRIGLSLQIENDDQLRKHALKTAQCKCKKPDHSSVLARRARDRKQRK
jgi:hypothetical protein